MRQIQHHDFNPAARSGAVREFAPASGLEADRILLGQSEIFDLRDHAQNFAAAKAAHVFKGPAEQSGVPAKTVQEKTRDQGALGFAQKLHGSG